MSLKVGGLYVKADGLQREDVVREIRAYWTARGAREVARSPLDLGPLDLRETGRLGFVVAEPAPSDGLGEWIAVYDSERHHGDAELAEHLHRSLDAPVILYQLAGATDDARTRTWGGAPQATSQEWGAVEEFVSRLPWSFLYFDQLHYLTEDDRKPLAPLRFEDVPERPGDYSGPGEVQRLKLRARALAAERDGPALRALVAAHPACAYEAVHGVAALDVHDVDARRTFLAVGDVALERGTQLDRLAVVAALHGDESLLDQAFLRMEAWYWWGLVTSQATQLLVAGHDVAAFRLLLRLCRQEAPSLPALNNLCHAALRVDDELFPVDLPELLEKAVDAGPQSVAIFHNLACVWLRLGRVDRALAAVDGAARWGYDELERMRHDEDLRSLWHDPRFEVALRASGPLDLRQLTTRTTGRTRSGQGPLVATRPVVELRLFLPELSRCAEAVAAVLQDVVVDRQERLTTHWLTGVGFTELETGALADDIGRLASAASAESIELRLGRSVNGEPGEWDITFDGYDDDWSKQSQLSVCWPWEVVHEDPDAFVSRVVELVSRLPFDAGGAGLHIATLEAETAVADTYLRPRLLGAEHHPRREWAEADRAPGSAWLTFLSDGIVGQLGGVDSLRAEIAPGELLTVGGGVCLRSSVQPPIGVRARPHDLGALPQIARALRPLRVDDADSQPHYARLDEIPGGSFGG